MKEERDYSSTTVREYSSKFTKIESWFIFIFLYADVLTFCVSLDYLDALLCSNICNTDIGICCMLI